MNRALGIGQTPMERFQTPVQKWFVNEDGGTYPYDPAKQAADFPNDSHTPYATQAEAEAAAEKDAGLPLYKVEVLIEVRAGDEEAAYAKVDGLMQRAWNDSQDEYEPVHWHYEMYDDCVSEALP